MYGLSKEDREASWKKINDTRFFLDNHFCDIGGKTFAYSQFFKNSFINSDRYVSELQNRAWSLYHYAQLRNLTNVFVTLTLPSEYHRYKTAKNGKLVKNPKFIDDEFHTPKQASKELSKLMRKIVNDRSYSKIPSENRLYFRVTEPHKNGTPHIHISFFMPDENVENFVEMINRKFPKPQSKVETDVKSPVNYLMKYILKTLDDLRGNNQNITDLSLWYVLHGINRFYTSRTLISLDIYRVLGGRYNLLELTTMYKNKELTVYYDGETNKIVEILDSFGRIYNRKPINLSINSGYESMKVELKPILKSKEEISCYKIPCIIDDVDYTLNLDTNELIKDIVTPAYMGDLKLYDYFNSLDVEDDEITLLHYGITQNEMISRGFITDIDIQPLDDFNCNFDYYADIRY